MNIVIDEKVVEGYQVALENSLKLLDKATIQFVSAQKLADENRLMSLQEACEYMRRNEDSVLNYRKGPDGLPYYKKGRETVLFRKGDIDDWLAKGYVNRHRR